MICLSLNSLRGLNECWGKNKRMDELDHSRRQYWRLSCLLSFDRMIEYLRLEGAALNIRSLAAVARESV